LADYVYPADGENYCEYIAGKIVILRHDLPKQYEKNKVTFFLKHGGFIRDQHLGLQDETCPFALRILNFTFSFLLTE